MSSPHHISVTDDLPALTYSGASSPASSAIDSDPFISEPGSPQSQQVQGHIPRPRNAFIIFRSYFYAQTRGNQNESSSNINQNALSCAAAAAWKALPEDQKKTFRKQAEDEKLMHYKKHPNYVYTPLNRAVKRAQKKKKKKKKSSAKRPAKKHRSSLSQRVRRRSTSDDSLLDDDDDVCCDGTKTDGESQKRVDLQFGQRPDVAFTQLPPTPPPTTADVPPYPNPGYPNWMFNELLGCGTPDAGPHAGWNPLQTTLNSYGDNYFVNNDTGNTFDDLSRYVNYDNVDTASDDYDGNWVGVMRI